MDPHSFLMGSQEVWPLLGLSLCYGLERNQGNSKIINIKVKGGGRILLRGERSNPLESCGFDSSSNLHCAQSWTLPSRPKESLGWTPSKFLSLVSLSTKETTCHFWKGTDKASKNKIAAEKISSVQKSNFPKTDFWSYHDILAPQDSATPQAPGLSSCDGCPLNSG